LVVVFPPGWRGLEVGSSSVRDDVVSSAIVKFSIDALEEVNIIRLYVIPPHHVRLFNHTKWD
jgi:hypothetical protein